MDNSFFRHSLDTSSVAEARSASRLCYRVAALTRTSSAPAYHSRYPGNGIYSGAPGTFAKDCHNKALYAKTAISWRYIWFPEYCDHQDHTRYCYALGDCLRCGLYQLRFRYCEPRQKDGPLGSQVSSVTPAESSPLSPK
jgi:hypothetical protein